MTDPSRPGPPPYLLGSMIGLTGGSAFVLVNRDELPSPWPVVALAAWVVLALVAVYALFVRRSSPPPSGGPRPRAGAVYAISVIAMVLVFVVGFQVLKGFDLAGLMPALALAAVGAHFIPFGAVFGAGRLFVSLGASLTVIGILGLLLGAFVGSQWAPAAAVLGGLVMVGLLAASSLMLPRRSA